MRGLVAVLAIAIATGGCHRLVHDQHRTDWLRLENQGRVVVAPHVLEVGEPRGRIWIRDTGRWVLVAAGRAVSEPLYLGDRAIVRVEDGDVSRDLLVGRDGRVFEMDEPGAVRADPGGASLSYVTCADDCRAVVIATYRDPRVDPVRRRVALPADACPAPMVASEVAWAPADDAALRLAVTCLGGPASWLCRTVAADARGVLRVAGDC
jgi:hypothetical protein